jgi:hypothetical protein
MDRRITGERRTPPHGSETPPRFRRIEVVWSGAEGDRTPGLVNAIHALSQLSYSPKWNLFPEKGSSIYESGPNDTNRGR